MAQLTRLTSRKAGFNAVNSLTKVFCRLSVLVMALSDFLNFLGLGSVPGRPRGVPQTGAAGSSLIRLCLY
eukprot:8332530-Pyramimonas_sp.AAC.1